MTIRSFLLKAWHADRERANSWLVVLAPCHVVVSIALLFKVRAEQMGLMFLLWAFLALIAAYCVFVNGLRKDTKPVWYIVIYWGLPLLAFSTIYGFIAAKTQGISLKSISVTQLMENSHEGDEDSLLTPGFRWVGDQHHVGGTLGTNLSIIGIGMLRFMLSVVVETPVFIYVMFVSTWLFQIRGRRP
ncbi:MAG: hypothetical protein JNJ77_02075 [Planctomycetia bacterium]|nr:hypothetical protein [Planctomycetia bacterium]